MEDEKRGPVSSDFGRLLRRFRLAAGLSQQALAERARVSVNGIGALERGERRSPQRHTMATIADALALDTDERAALEAAARSCSTRRGANIAFGPWETPASHVPAPLTSFIGRETECAEILAVARDQRLVTIVGSGGIGKTRTALEVGAMLGTEFGIARFAELAPISDPAFVTSVVASAFDLREAPKQPLLDTLIEHLRPRKAVLLLDNCEHVIDEAARVCDVLLKSCPELRIIATSREALRIEGEHRFRLPSLDELSAVALFAARAAAANNRFAVDAASSPLISAICRSLDGIPLAIELAAARVGAIPLKALAEQLEQRLDVLSGGLRTAPARQQTMRAAIAWSYDLLSERERRAFECLSVFAGGCRFEEASAVCALGIGAPGESEVLELLTALAQKSLIGADEGPRGLRYRMDHVIRQFALERLAEHCDARLVARGHAVAYLALAEHLWDANETQPDAEWNAAAAAEVANWRTALEWTLGQRNDPELGMRLAAALSRSWYLFAPAEGFRWLEIATSLTDEETSATTLARLAYAHARAAGKVGMGDAVGDAFRALEHCRQAGDDRITGRALFAAATALVELGRYAEAAPLAAEAVQVARNLGAVRLIGDALSVLGYVRLNECDYGGAGAYFGEAHETFRRLGQDLADNVASGFSEAAFMSGDCDAAIRMQYEAIAAARRRADPFFLAGSLVNVALYLNAVDEFARARQHAREALQIAQTHHYEIVTIAATLHLAAAAALDDAATTAHVHERRRIAARLLGYFGNRCAAMGIAIWPPERREYDRLAAHLEREIGDTERVRLAEAGAQMTADESVREAMRA